MGRERSLTPWHRAERSPTLGELQRLGVRQLRFCCVRRSCDWSYPLALDRLVQRFGKDREIRILARAARCRNCRAQGAHVEALGFGQHRGSLGPPPEPRPPWTDAARARADRGFSDGREEKDSRTGQPRR